MGSPEARGPPAHPPRTPRARSPPFRRAVRQRHARCGARLLGAVQGATVAGRGIVDRFTGGDGCGAGDTTARSCTRERAHARARARWGACTYQCEVDCTLQPSVTADVNLSADVPSPPELSTIAPRGGLPRCLLHLEWRTHPLRCAWTVSHRAAHTGMRGRARALPARARGGTRRFCRGAKIPAHSF